MVQEFQSLFDGYVAAYESGDAERCASVYTDDGQLHSPFGPPAVGRAAIAETQTEWFADDEDNKSVSADFLYGPGTIAHRTRVKP